MSRWQWLVVNRVARKLATRLSVLTLVLAVAWLVFGHGAEDLKHHRLGTAYLGYDTRAECFLIRGERPRVLDSGLIDGRGIVMTNDEATPSARSTPRQVLYVADAWEGVYRFYVDNAPGLAAPDDGELVLAHTTQVCPEGYCEQADYGGMLAHPRGLVLSDAQRQQLLVRRWNGYFEPAVGDPFLRSVRDVTWIPEEQAFLAAIGDSPQDTPSGDASGDKRSGEIIWVSESQSSKQQTPASITGLRRPVGVAWSARTQRLYVADVDGKNEVWSYYNRSANGWRKAGTLWRQDVGPFGSSIRLQDMVVADFDYAIVSKGAVKECVPSRGAAAEGGAKEEVVVSAGPDGIYVFHSDGSLLAKYYIGRPVAGLAWGPVDSKSGADWLYFTSGPQIGVLKTLLKNPQPALPHLSPAQPALLRFSPPPPASNSNTAPAQPPGGETPSTPPSRAPHSPPPKVVPVGDPPPTPTTVELPSDVLFEFGKWNIRDEALPRLEQTAALLRRRSVTNARVEGHTDNKGTDDFNLKLSLARARAVSTWLAQQDGLRQVRFSIQALGARHPVAPNTNPDGSDNPQGRTLNRRVLVVIDKTQ